MSFIPAAVVAHADKIGTIAPGYIADLAVFTPQGADGYTSILAATPKDVRLTMVGGKILYGDAQLASAATPACEAIAVCGASKFVCVAEATATDKLDQTLSQIKGALEAALLDVDALTKADGYDFAPLAPLVKCP